MDVNIHLIWLIDEYAKIFFIFVWFIPIIPLIILLMITINIRKLILLKFEYLINVIGAIFCHVSIIKELVHDNPWIISGNQKWNGAAPILINRADV